MSIREAYGYWYHMARVVFAKHLQQYGYDVAMEKLRLFTFHANGKYAVRKEQGDPSWRYEYARFLAYRSLRTKLTNGAL